MESQTTDNKEKCDESSCSLKQQRRCLSAINELDNVFELRRHLLIITHLAMPFALLFASQSSSFREPEWLQRHALDFAAMGMMIVALFMCTLTLTCHRNLVRYSAIVNRSLYEKPTSPPPLHHSQKTLRQRLLRDLNIFGVGTLFLYLSTLSFSFAAGFLGYRLWTSTLLSCLITITVVFAMTAILILVHHRAIRDIAQDVKLITDEKIREELWFIHRCASVHHTWKDISIVVVMATALCLGIIVVIDPFEQWKLSKEIKPKGIIGISLYLYGLLVLFFSQMMVLRLRYALAEHASYRGFLTGRRGNEWTFSYLEPTFCLYIFILILLLSLVNALFHGSVFSWGFSALSVLLSVYYYRQKLGREGESFANCQNSLDRSRIVDERMRPYPTSFHAHD